MAKQAPTKNEAKFGIEELFFSRTDLKGRIEFGNDVFVRVSGYQKEDLLGAPHNTIRHPDMPKAIFKLFWEMLLAKKAVAAYVKNMAANGDYYWVLAVACPAAGGYLSIRLKPSSAYFVIAKELYALLLGVEVKSGMDSAYALLEVELNKRGFASYDEFITGAVRAELESREAAAPSSGVSESSEHFQHIKQITKQGSQCFNQLFAQVDTATQTNKSFSKRSSETLDEFRELGFLSLNMMISAEKFGNIAASLSVISSEFSKQAAVIEECVRSFKSASEHVAEGIRISNFNISALKLQMEMVDFFISESLRANAFSDINANREAFLELAESSSYELVSSLNFLLNKINVCENEIAALGEFVRSLELIRLIGRVEASREEALKSAFQNQIEGLSQFTGKVRVAIDQFQEELGIMRKSIRAMNQDAARGKEILKAIFAALPPEQEQAHPAA